VTAFAAWFEKATEHAPRPWQAELASSPECRDRLVRIPTGFGKTLGVLGAWVYRRVVLADERWPRRLLWTLPMRVLVEQTEAEVRSLLGRLDLLWSGEGDHRGKVGVHALMGGSDAGDWHLWPEEAAVLLGTQDMLLSRALNRGYGAARGRWPTDFGLVSADALWVLDEVQLMDVGLATAAQLAAFRLEDAPRSVRPSFTWAMSATLQRTWLTKSPDTSAWVGGLRDQSLADRDRQADLWATTKKPIRRCESSTAKTLAARVVAHHSRLTGPAPLTLVVHNTVDRARESFDELLKLCTADAEGSGPSIHLLHSRFRGVERSAWRTDLLGPDAPKRSRIVVATQVIEAGVDLSADALFTDLCPWASLVQRLGRLARRGGSGEAFVLGLDTARHAAPYEVDDLDASWDALEQLTDGSPRELEAFEQANPDLLAGLYPYDPPHLLLREELDELFDTTPDLSGADIDVSRFIRSGEERDVSVFWVQAPSRDRGVGEPDHRLRAVRDGLCAVPFLRARDWLCGKATGGHEPKKLRDNVGAWVWDYLSGRWLRAERSDLRPGQSVLVDAAVGGYSPLSGWDPAVKGPVTPLVAPAMAGPQDQADAAQDQEELSQAAWQTIGFHGAAVATEVGKIASDLAMTQAGLLQFAGRWHDLGKAHAAFQGAINGPGRPDRVDLAKAPSNAWRRGREMYRCSEFETRPGFRHELASTLALFAVLERHAPAEHPSRLGALASLFLSNQQSRPSSDPGPLEAEVLALAPEAFDLVAYLVCSHHGKVRGRMHAAPVDQRGAPKDGTMPIRGIRDGDSLPQVALVDAKGELRDLPARSLSLEPAVLGLSPRTGRSWSERVNSLLGRHGPFALAFLEAVLRAADVRASKDRALVDPRLVIGEKV
jgi:CRISPR-associated endonuclease/helicase Cas3